MKREDSLGRTIVLIARKKHRRALGFLASGLVVAAIVASIDLWDRAAADIIHETVNDAAIDLAVLVGILGSPVPYFIPSAVAFAFFKFQHPNTILANRALFLLLSSTNAPFLADLLKLVFGRSRPHLWIEHGVYTFRLFTNSLDFSSFPSEHASVAAALAATFSIFVPTYRPTFYLVAIVVACSRVVIGVHYPSDMMAGMLVGLISVSMIAASFRRYKLDLHPQRAAP
jgi:membrane-associated phospholipid phosphatase